MSDNVPNSEIYRVLLDIKEDIGGLKTSADLQLKGLTNHSTRIGTLEGDMARQKGMVKMWGMIAAGTATIVGGAMPSILKLFK